MGHKILLADDSITIQKVIELTFSDEDFELHTVGNGQKAIDEIRSITPDIVLCDIIMPEKNGYEVCEFIKSSDDLRHIPVLLLTGAFEPFDQERAKAAGCEGFLAKPFEPQTLISKVKELLASAQGPGAGASPPPSMPEPAAPPPPSPPTPELINTQSAAPVESDATVLVPPPAVAPPPPVSGPQVPASPPPPPAPAPEPPGLDAGFAVEAGNRELAMDPGDHTMLLGADEASEVTQTPSSGGEDIWSEVSAAPEPPPAQEEDAATVFMTAPPPVVQPDDMDLGVSSGSEDPDATWQMPGGESDSGSSVPSPPDYGAFEDFTAPTPTSAEPVQPPRPVRPPQPPEPADVSPPAPMSFDDASSEPSADPFTPAPPEIVPSTDEPMTPEPIPSVDTEATIDPVAAGADAYPPLTPPPARPEPPSSAQTPQTPEVPAMTSEPETPFTPVEPAASEPSTVEPIAPQPAALQEASAGSETSSSGNADDDLVERVAQRVVDKLSSKIIQEIAWEVVPDLAEGMIQKEIDALKSKMPR